MRASAAKARVALHGVGAGLQQPLKLRDGNVLEL